MRRYTSIRLAQKPDAEAKAGAASRQAPHEPRAISSDLFTLLS
jgi:hypothetical protein